MRLKSVFNHAAAMGLLALAVVGAQAQQAFGPYSNVDVNQLLDSTTTPVNATQTATNTLTGNLSNAVTGVTANLTRVNAATTYQANFARIHVRNSAYAATVNGTIIPINSTSTTSPWASTADAVMTGNIVAAPVTSGSTWTFQFFNSATTGTAPRARWTTIAFSLNTTTFTPPSSIDAGTFTNVGDVFNATVALGVNEVRWYRFTTTAATVVGGFGIQMQTLGAVAQDTEITLYDANGVMLGNNDDRLGFGTGGSSGGLFFSWLQWGATGNQNIATGTPPGLAPTSLPAGTYYLAVAGWNATQSGGFSVTAASAARTFDLRITVPAPPAPPSSFIDLGTFGASGQANSDNQNVATVRWYRFETTQDTVVNAALNGFGVRMWTSSDTAANPNTEIGLFDNSGVLLGNNDNRGTFGSGGASLSWMQFGATGNQNVAAATNLAAGTYWLAAGLFDTAFQPGWTVTTTATIAAEFRLNVLVPHPPSPPGTFVDAGNYNAAGDNFTETYTYGPAEVRWYRFVTGQATVVNAALNGFGIRMWTSNDAAVNVDSHIGLYDNNGVVLAVNDDRGSFGSGGAWWSWLQWGATGNQNVSGGSNPAALTAGTYWLAVSRRLSTFAGGWAVTGGGTGTGDIRTNFLSPNPPSPPGTFTDVGSFGGASGTFLETIPTTAFGEVRWYRLTLTAATATSGLSMEFETLLNGATAADTEVGVFDGNGVLLASNDDNASGTGSPSPFSYLRWGGAGNVNIAGGSNPASLAPGTYWVAVGLFNVTYGSGWTATGAGGASTVPFDFRIRATVPATAVTGTVQYPVWGPGLNNYPVTVQLRQGSTVVQSFSTTLDGAGQFTVQATAPAGSYDVFVRGPRLTWRVGAAPITLPSGTAVNAGVFAPFVGDVLQDNVVDGLDLAAMDATFGLALGDTGYNPFADLNGDDIVDGLDLAILDANFGQQGDGDLP